MLKNMIDPFQPDTLLLLALIGTIAGSLGGLLGVGGSIVVIPSLVILFGPGENQHLYQASAMTANLAVAIPAARRHRRAQAITPPVIKWMLPAALAAIVLGVFASNLPLFKNQAGGIWLGRLLAVFLLYVIAMNILKLTRSKAKVASDRARQPLITPVRCASVGGIMGLAAGLLGIGGGGLAVPLQQTLVKLTLRNAIANSSLVMVFSAAIGAALKLATLEQHYPPLAGQWPAWQTAVLLAGILAPTAILGAGLGAKLTHTLPLTYVRIAFIAMLAAAAYKMAALPVSMF